MSKVLVTGASSGIGLASAKLLHQQGWSVTGIARNFEASEHSFMQCESIDLSQVEGLPGELAARSLESFDCLLLNAGIGRFGGLEQFSYTQIRELIDLNLVSNLVLLKYFLPQLKRAGGKDIVLIGSEAALQGAKQGALYSASKFAIRGLAQSLRADCASADVRVMLINPGPTASDFFDELHFQPQSGEGYAISPDTVAEAIVRALALPRNVVQDEISLQPVKRAFEKKRPD